MSKITVQNTEISVVSFREQDYICLTDIARIKNPVEPKDVVKNWLRLKNTIEYLGFWEILNNPDFKGVEFDPLLAAAGSNSFTMSPSRWIEATNAKGIITKNGKNGGTYAHRDIAFKFANWVSVEFELYLIKEFQRLKEEEQRQLGWSAKRELAKINYRIHTDAIKQNLIPPELTPEQKSLVYADEADMLNVAMDLYVGSRVRMRRSLLGMSQERLAAELGVTFQQVQKYERGLNRIGASRLWDLAQVLGVNVDFFYQDIDTNTSDRKSVV